MDERKNRLEPSDNVIRIGKKPPRAYVEAIERNFENGHRYILVHSRGKANSTALDAVAIVLRRLADIKMREIKLDTEPVKITDRNSGREITINLTALTIVLSKR